MTDSPPPRLTANEGDSICKTLGSRTGGQLTHTGRRSSVSHDASHSAQRGSETRRSKSALEPVPWVEWSSDSSSAERDHKDVTVSKTSRLPSPAAYNNGSSNVLDAPSSHSPSHTISEATAAQGEENEEAVKQPAQATHTEDVLRPIEPHCRYSDYPPRYRHTRAYYCPHCTYTVCPACFVLLPRPRTITNRNGINDEIHKTVSSSCADAEGQAEGCASPPPVSSLHTRLAALLQTPASAIGNDSPITPALTPSPTQAALPSSSVAGPLCHLCKNGPMTCEEVLLYPWSCEGPMPERRLRRGAHIVYDTDIIQRYYFIKEQTAKRAASVQPLIGHYHGVLLHDNHESTMKSERKSGDELYCHPHRPPYCEEGGRFVFSVTNPRLVQSCVWCAVNLQPREADTSFTGDTTITPLFTWSCPPTLPGLPAIRACMNIPHGLYGMHGVHALALYVTSDIYRKATSELTLSPMAASYASPNAGRLTTLRLSPASMLQPLLVVDILHHMYTRSPPLTQPPLSNTHDTNSDIQKGETVGRKRPRAASLDLLSPPKQVKEDDANHESDACESKETCKVKAQDTWPEEQMYCPEAARCVDHLLQGRSVAVYGLASKYFFLHHVAHAAALKTFALWSIDASVPEAKTSHTRNGNAQSRSARMRQASTGGIARQLRELERHLAQVAAQAAEITTNDPEVALHDEDHVVKVGHVRSASPSRPAISHQASHSATNAVVVNVDDDTKRVIDAEKEETTSVMPTSFTRRSHSSAPSPPLPLPSGHEAFLTPATAVTHTHVSNATSEAAHIRDEEENVSTHTVCSLSAAHEPADEKVTRVLHHPLLDPQAPWAEAVSRLDFCMPRILQSSTSAVGEDHTNIAEGDAVSAKGVIVPCKVTMPRIRFSSEAQRTALVNQLYQSHVPRCVAWHALPSYLAAQLAQPSSTHDNNKETELDIAASLLWHGANAKKAPTLLVVHNMDLLPSIHIATLQRLILRYAQPRHGHLQLFFSFDHPHWPTSLAAASLQPLHPVMLELRHKWWLPRIHEMQAYNSNTLELLTSVEAGAAVALVGGSSLGDGRRGRHGTRGLTSSKAAAASAFASGSLVMQDTMRRILFSLPAAFAELLRIMIATQEEAGEGHLVSLFTHMEKFEQNGLMVSQGRLQALKRELTSNRLAVYDAAEHALHIPQHRKLAKVLEEVTAQRNAVSEAKGLAEMT